MRSARPGRAGRAGPCAGGLAAGGAGDLAKAFRFFRRAAASGEAEGAYRLGLLYLRGEGVVASLSDGVVWLLRAAEQGHAEAQYQLSLAYLHGGADRRHRAVVSRRGGGPRRARRAQSRV